MDIIRNVIEFIFSSALFVNALLFIPQAVRIFKEKTTQGVSLLTFAGFLFIQFTIVLHGIINQDYLLGFGYLLSMLTCGAVVALLLFYKKNQNLISSEEITLGEILEQLPGHIYWKNKEGVCWGCNTNNWRDFGLSSLADFKGKTDYDFFSKQEADKLRLVDQEVMRTGQIKIVEEELTTLDGKPALYWSHKIPLRNKHQQVIGMLGVSVDITHAKKETANQLKMLEDIIGIMPGNVYWMSKDGVYLGCNDNQAKAIGLTSRKDIVGKRNVDMPGFLIAEVLDKVNREVMEIGKAVTIEEPALLHDGAEATFLSNKVPLRNGDGEITGMVGVSIDITERKEVEQELIFAKEAASQAKTEFLKNIRHDIRTPLTGIIGFANLVKEEAKDIKTIEYIDNMLASSHALLELLNEVLDAMRVTSGEVPLLKMQFDLRSRLEAVIKLNLAKASEKQLSLVLHYDEAIPRYLIGDPKRIHRIILELVTNALNFTSQGKVEVTATLAKMVEQDVVITITVADTGMGIPENKQQEIFTRFQRLTSSYEGRYKGLGLGLSIVKQFIDDLEGELYLESDQQQGSLFTCVIPLKKTLLNEPLCTDKFIADLTKTELPVLKEHIVAVNNSDRSFSTGETSILLVEDNTLVAKVTQAMLSSFGCIVDIAVDGQCAISLAKSRKYDLIFMDVGLPDIEGDVVTKQIREWELLLGKHTPIVALTAHVDAENKQQCIEAGMDAVLAKPMSKETATDILTAFIPKHHTKSASPNASEKQADSAMDELFQLPSKVIDLELGAKLVNGDKNNAQDMIKLLLTSLSQGFPELQKAYEQRDWKTIRNITHKLHGGACYCGTPRFKSACNHLENYLKTGKTELRDALYQQLLQEIDAVTKAIA